MIPAAYTKKGGESGSGNIINNYFATFQHVYLLLVDSVLVFLQETLTLVLHLGTKDRVIQSTRTLSSIQSLFGSSDYLM